MKGSSSQLKVSNHILAGFVKISCLPVAILLTLGVHPDTFAVESAVDTLAVVNGEPVTSAHLDSLVMRSHQSGNLTRIGSGDLRRLLDKAINDRLILQEAYAMGMDQEEDLLAALDEKRTENAVKAFVAARFAMPDKVPGHELQAYFDRYYWKILLRQISVRTEAEAQDVREALLKGADMDSLARALSLDTQRYKGGLHNLKYWADVENVLREVARGLEINEVSQPFPFREAYAIIRVERRDPVDQEAFTRYKRSINAHLITEARKVAWQEFIADLLRETPVNVDEEVLASLREDADVIFRGEFLKQAERPALSIDADHYVTETKLRKEVSHTAMSSGTDPFETLLIRGIESAREKLVLGYYAEQDGYFETPEIIHKYTQDLKTALIEAYLAEVIVPQIVFKREEFEEYYTSHSDDFREADQVKLAIIVVQTEQEASEIEQRLAGGADFDFLKRQYEGTGSDQVSQAEWASVAIFSQEIQEELAQLKIGGTSQAIQTRTDWMLFKVIDRRVGELKDLADVEMRIRQVMFQRKFNQLLDEHLALLKEHSEIVLNQEAIDTYFGVDAASQP